MPGIAGAHHPAIAPYGMFETATAPVQVAVGSEGLWQRFATAVGIEPEQERFRRPPGTVTPLRVPAAPVPVAALLP